MTGPTRVEANRRLASLADSFSKEDLDLTSRQAAMSAILNMRTKGFKLRGSTIGFGLVDRMAANAADFVGGALGVALGIRQIVEGIKSGNPLAIADGALGTTGRLIGMTIGILEYVKSTLGIIRHLFLAGAIIGQVISSILTIISLFVPIGPSQDRLFADHAKKILEPLDRFLIDGWRKTLDDTIIAPAQ